MYQLMQPFCRVKQRQTADASEGKSERYGQLKALRLLDSIDLRCWKKIKDIPKSRIRTDPDIVSKEKNKTDVPAATVLSK